MLYSFVVEQLQKCSRGILIFLEDKPIVASPGRDYVLMRMVLLKI
jgi:hypothetical protein